MALTMGPIHQIRKNGPDHGWHSLWGSCG
jgi:hypothetical protein